MRQLYITICKQCSDIENNFTLEYSIRTKNGTNAHAPSPWKLQGLFGLLSPCAYMDPRKCARQQTVYVYSDGAAKPGKHYQHFMAGA